MRKECLEKKKYIFAQCLWSFLCLEPGQSESTTSGVHRRLTPKGTCLTKLTTDDISRKQAFPCGVFALFPQGCIFAGRM